MHIRKLLGVGFIAFWFFLSACATTRSVHHGSFSPQRMPGKADSRQMANVRVALFQNVPRLRIGARGPVKIYDMSSRAVIDEASLGEETQFTVHAQQFVINGRTLLAQKIRLVPNNNDDALKVNGLRYRGQLELTCVARGGILAVNFVPVEDYLKGVVPNEVLYTWPVEALKAQAVAARTFTLSRMGASSEHADYDVEAGTNSQVYRGLDSEREATNRAVEASAHLVATYQGRFISAFYHSNCGGHTADVRHVWGSDTPYLKGVVCGFCDDSPHAVWSLALSRSELVSALAQRNIKTIQSLEMVGRLPDGRALSLEIRHDGVNEVMKAAAFRMLVGPERLKSTNFEISPSTKNVVFKGRGWGHGVGLCQEGACGLARAGYGFNEILQFYYPGSDIQVWE
ncbi:MAG: SpoIID/LytB domain-containing protein [Candidatus Firestonebacteria bacterium]|nr:SpoIID/LytB domain-containing protein [Candidatus Firestonebacteria bacterium]